MKLELSQKQTTQLFMTTEIRQAISLLQYSTLDVWNYIKDAALENPLLDVDHEPMFSTFSDASVDYVQAPEKPWRESLLQELRLELTDRSLINALAEMIGNLDDQGFLQVELSSNTCQFDRALTILKNYEHKGFGCSGPTDYIRYQVLTHFPHSGEEWKEIVDGASSSHHIMEKLRTLPPYPSFGWEKDTKPVLLPDLLLRMSNNSYELSYPNCLLPWIRINPSATSLANHAEASEFLKDCQKQADWLIASVKKRKATIMKVGMILIQEQRDFLDGGYLKPLSLKDVSRKLGVHESTVSRAVADKYMQTPTGMLPLRSLFSSRVKQTEGVSSSQVKYWLKMAIDLEDPGAPLSDQTIVHKLMEDHNLRVSRRTIAKYREAMKIPSSSKRKKKAVPEG